MQCTDYILFPLSSFCLVGVGVLLAADGQSTSRVSGLPLGPLTRVYFALLSLDNYVVLFSMRPL
jgi:hypothetical protein